MTPFLTACIRSDEEIILSILSLIVTIFYVMKSHFKYIAIEFLFDHSNSIARRYIQ